MDSGDIYYFVSFARQGKAFLVEHAPLESFVRCLLVDISLWVSPKADLITELKILNCFYGAVFFFCVTVLCSRLPLAYAVFAPVLLIITPIQAVFCGYMEIYGLPIAVQNGVSFS